MCRIARPDPDSRKANNVTGIAQASLRIYKQVHAQNQSIEVIELLAKADAFGQELFRETIRQIQLSEPMFTKSQIAQWVDEGKIDADHAPLFEQLCVSSITSPNKSLQPTAKSGTFVVG
jgi:hypothetical protein